MQAIECLIFMYLYFYNTETENLDVSREQILTFGFLNYSNGKIIAWNVNKYPVVVQC